MSPVAVLTAHNYCRSYRSSDSHGFYEPCGHHNPCNSVFFVIVVVVVVIAIVAIIIVIVIITIMTIVILIAVLRLVEYHCIDGLMYITLYEQPYCNDCFLQILCNFIVFMVSNELFYPKYLA